MTTTYGGAPGTSSRDEIRFLIGDTTSPFTLTDEEITYLLTIYPKVAGVPNYEGAIAAAITAASYFTKRVSKTVGTLSLQYSEQQDKFLAIADRYRALVRGGVSGQSPSVSGVPILFGGGPTILGPDDTPEYYSH